jgi:hypothetical protein
MTMRSTAVPEKSTTPLGRASPAPRRIALAVLALVFAAVAVAQEAPKPAPAAPPAAAVAETVPLLNPGFESTAPGILGFPQGWVGAQHAGPLSYTFTLDTTTRHSGEKSMRIENVGKEPYGVLSQLVRATALRGRTVRFSGWLKSEGITGNRFGTGGVLTLSTMKGGNATASNNMQATAVKGRTDWTRYEVTLAVAPDTEEIEVGAMLHGPGTLWFDDALLEALPPAR